MVVSGHPAPLSADFRTSTLVDLLKARGVTEVVALDLFDERAELRFDMNERVPADYFGRFGSLIDIGSLEHVFDTRQCLENCLRMLSVGGWYFLHVPVNGYFAHGLHVFNPQGIADAVRLNGFEIRELLFTDLRGRRVANPARHGHRLMWLVAQKAVEVAEFVVPQQGYWTDFYRATDAAQRRKVQSDYWAGVGRKRSTTDHL
ncbi:hypothetical protein E1258_06420 [Micromonospora sp. KC207]|uniref:hypothetical protein n=1 Tax=Micromonospora sp. KC207 TaxID=2530377 RepID=UPI001053355D|nr:hypothetical protein [Micromonospora sp. KC207]TDC65124.1 hypothetical protein E1258_06420 [Micromonospora sp. KC207]